MYNNGLIDPQFPLYKDFAPVDDLISRGFVGAFTANYDWPIRTTPGDYNNLKTNVSGAELVPVDCFPNAQGKNVKQKYLPTGIYNFVPASSTNVEGAVKYFDFLCQQEVRTYLTTGEEGVNHKKDENGIPVMINLKNDPRMMNSPNNLDYAMIVNGVDLGDPEKNVLVLSKSYEAGYEEIFVKAYNMAMKDAIVYNNKIIPFASEAQFSTTLGDKRKEVMANAITAGTADFDRVFDAGIQEWLGMGGQQCVDERQAFWNEHFK
jgi:putative aldouronate transport system substrate-binding protein